MIRFMRSFSKNALLLSTMSILAPSLSLLALASQTAQSQSIERLPVQQLAGRPEDAENSSDSGAVRGECPVGTKNLKAINPVKDPGQTTQAYPTLWFYLPFGQTESAEITVTSAQFDLLNEDGESVLKQPLTLALPEQAGVVSVTLPSTEKALEVGKDYYWTLSIVCDADQPSTNPSVSGWLKRVQATPQLVNQLKQVPPQDQYLAYKNGGFWFEHVTQLANNRSKHPDEWSKLLQSFDLQEFATKSVSELRPERN